MYILLGPCRRILNMVCTLSFICKDFRHLGPLSMDTWMLFAEICIEYDVRLLCPLSVMSTWTSSSFVERSAKDGRSVRWLLLRLLGSKRLWESKSSDVLRVTGEVRRMMTRQNEMPIIDGDLIQWAISIVTTPKKNKTCHCPKHQANWCMKKVSNQRADHDSDK